MQVLQSFVSTTMEADYVLRKWDRTTQDFFVFPIMERVLGENLEEVSCKGSGSQLWSNEQALIEIQRIISPVARKFFQDAFSYDSVESFQPLSKSINFLKVSFWRVPILINLKDDEFRDGEVFDALMQLQTYHQAVANHAIYVTRTHWRFFHINRHRVQDHVPRLHFSPPIKWVDRQAIVWWMGRTASFFLFVTKGNIPTFDTALPAMLPHQELFNPRDVLLGVSMFPMLKLTYGDTKAKSKWMWVNLPAIPMTDMIPTSVEEVFVLSHLGTGNDGKVVYVVDRQARTAAFKFILRDRRSRTTLPAKIVNAAEEEANVWKELYSDLCERRNWQVRAERWSGHFAVVMPLLSPIPRDERHLYLPSIHANLRLAASKGFHVSALPWRNIARDPFVPFDARAILIDLTPYRIRRETLQSDRWINELMECLQYDYY